MNPSEAEQVLLELQRRKTEHKELFDNLWSLYKPTPYDFNRVRVCEVQDMLSGIMNCSKSPSFRRTITHAISRKGCHIVFINGKRHYRGLVKL